MENPAKMTSSLLSSSSSSSDGQSAKQSNEKSEEGKDNKSLDDLPPSPSPQSESDQRSGSKPLESTVPGSIVPETGVPGLSASEHITPTEHSDSVDTYIPANDKHFNTTEPSPEINHRLGMNLLVSPDSPVRGVKRKFLGSHFEAQRRKRQKTYHHINTKEIGGRKRKTEYDLNHVRKHLKTSSENGQSDIAVPDLIRGCESGSDSAITASCSTAQSGENTVEDDEGDEEGQPCSGSCVCQVGPSELPLEIERRFDTAEPLYRACLQRRIFSLANTQYVCCKNRCLKKYFRVKVIEKYLRHMNEDYYRSDLSVHEYSWGEWKD